MKLVTISLKDAELKALLEIKNINNIGSLHKAIKIAIGEYIKRFMEKEGESHG
jgi:Asp-tRNA(Asn)/Glu-tRNA(Gln) amidotransferase B subunit